MNSPKKERVLIQVRTITKLGDIRNIAKDLKKDNDLAMELWSTGEYLARQLAILIMDPKLLTQELINKLDKDMHHHPVEERLQLIDWLMANQLVKNKKTITLINTWENSVSALQRRVYWYYQGRLRWMGQPPPQNTGELVTAIESRIMKEEPGVQWAMNFTAGWIGVYEEKYRTRCIAIGEQTGLYRDEMVSKGCTPKYLPEFIRIEGAKRRG